MADPLEEEMNRLRAKAHIPGYVHVENHHDPDDDGFGTFGAYGERTKKPAYSSFTEAYNQEEDDFVPQSLSGVAKERFLRDRELRRQKKR